MKTNALLCFFFVGVLLCGNAGAYSLYFDPGLQTVDLNETAALSVWISGLGNYAGPNLGAYDVKIGYDQSQLQLISLTFHEYLGLTGTGSFSTAVTDVLRVWEVSILSDAELSAIQPGSFPLVSMEFRMQSQQDTQIALLEAVLSDGDAIPLYATLDSANVYAVPLPASLLMLASALAGFFGVRRVTRS